jgi:hypothetical protein
VRNRCATGASSRGKRTQRQADLRYLACRHTACGAPQRPRKPKRVPKACSTKQSAEGMGRPLRQ